MILLNLNLGFLLFLFVCLFFLSGREPGCLPREGLCGCQAEQHWVAPAGARGWHGKGQISVLRMAGQPCRADNSMAGPRPCLGTGEPWLGSAAGCGASRCPCCNPTGSRCGRAGLHSPNLLQPDRITMPACWGIMAGVCLRYKGTGLSHEVILISYALIHCSACQPAMGPAAAPTRLC